MIGGAVDLEPLSFGPTMPQVTTEGASGEPPKIPDAKKKLAEEPVSSGNTVKASLGLIAAVALMFI